MIQTNYFDENEYAAFISDESRIFTDDREIDEFSPENILHNELDTDCMGNCFSDSDPEL